MDRALIEGYLAEGLSLAEIGRRVGRHESTVSYWLAKYGLKAAHRVRHRPRGGVERAALQELVDRGLSVREIGLRMGVSGAAVRRWLGRYGMATMRAAEQRARDGHEPNEYECPRHGHSVFVQRSDGGYRCSRCRAEAVVKRRRAVKSTLVAEAGGSCVLCGYDRCASALAFHHLVPEEKHFSISHRGVTRSLARARAEADKCVLLCSNCHAEVEAGMIVLARTVGG